MSRRLLHTHAALNGIILVYACKFISADLTKPGSGRTLWKTPDFKEAMDLWAKTIGEPHDQGKFTLVAEAVYEETDAIPRPRKLRDNLDLFESKNAVSTELPDEATGGPEDQSPVVVESIDGRGDVGIDRLDP